MKIIKWATRTLLVALTMLLCLGAPARAGVVYGSVTVSSPASGATVVSPFTLSATDATCANQPVQALGYSLDSSPNTTIVNGTSVQAKVTAPLGTHVLRVKSWGKGGTACATLVPINVVNDPALALVPANATAVKLLQTEPQWKNQFDPGTGSGAGATGSMQLTQAPSVDGSARQFNFSYTNNGGELFYVSWGNDVAAHNFLYDGWVYVPAANSNIANIEMDMNQVVDGVTYIYGFQCDGWNGTWDYTDNVGTLTQTKAHWIYSNQPCNPRKWTTNAWHHVQVTYSRDDKYNITYKSVWLDGVEQDINKTVFSGFSLGWANGVLLTNFQLDGIGKSGAATVYLDNLSIYRW